MAALHSRKVALMAILQGAQVVLDNTDDVLASAQSRNSSSVPTDDATVLLSNRKGGIVGRKWALVLMWLFHYAFQPDFRVSSDWRDMFRIPFGLFTDICEMIRPDVQMNRTRLRETIVAEKHLAAVLMAASSATYRRIANQLGMGPSTVRNSVQAISKAICRRFADVLSLPS